MPYSDIDDLKKDLSEEELIQLTDDKGLGAIDTEIYAGQRDDADAEIDGYLTGGGYTVPLLPVPTLIKKISKAITSYNLHKRKLKLNIPDSLNTDYNNQVKLLKAIQEHKVSIGVTIAQSGAGDGSYKTNKASTDKTFSKDVLDTY